MSHDKIGPKEAQQRLLRDRKLAKKPSTTELRGRIAKVKGANQTLRKGGRKR
jgi:hypothetical protein